MPRKVATTQSVDLEGLLAFVRPRHKFVLITHRASKGLQASPVTGGVDDEGRLVIATYGQRAKAKNARINPRVSVIVLSDDWEGPWVHIDGTAEVLDLPEALEPLVTYFRNIAGEHPDWADYRRAMIEQNKSLIRITPTRWSPLATGGFPPDAV